MSEMQCTHYRFLKVPVLQRKTGTFIVQNRLFCNAKQPLLQRAGNKIVTP